MDENLGVGLFDLLLAPFGAVLNLFLFLILAPFNILIPGFDFSFDLGSA